MKRLLALMFLGSFAGSGILAYSPISAAYLRMSSATACAVNTITGGPAATATYSGQGILAQSWAALDVFCSYVEHSGSEKDKVSTIYVDVYDGSAETGQFGQVWAKACSQPYLGGPAANCGGSRSTEGYATGFTGPATLFLGGPDVKDVWGPGHGDDYATLYVGLGKSSRFFGFATN